MFDASQILGAEESFDLRRISKIIKSGGPTVAALAKLIVHEDNHQLVIFKPPGWLSQSDQTGDLSVNEIFAAYLKEKYAKPGNVFCAAVQRLDRPASGLMVLARTSKGAARISEEIRNGRFEKQYRVLTDKPLLAQGKISQKIVLSADMVKTDRMAKKVGKEVEITGDNAVGQRYLLSARLVNDKMGVYHYCVEIEGGKFHQIRALFAAHGSPLIGDVKYGGKKLKRHSDRIALVASLLRYRHPTQDSLQLFSVSQASLEKLPAYFI